jgi:hypothetical protein
MIHGTAKGLVSTYRIKGSPTPNSEDTVGSRSMYSKNT